ncbi:MAG: hypothetical protein Kow0068_19110 [Marinilabiliales bacterium]
MTFKHSLIITLFLISYCLSAQNLVPNSQMQEGTNNPEYIYPDESHNEADNFDGDISFWKSARIRYKNCFFHPQACIPSVDWMEVNCTDNNMTICGHPVPKIAGNRYIHLTGDPGNGGNANYDTYKEGVIIKLNQTLVKNTPYTLRFLVATLNTEPILRIHLTEWNSSLPSSNTYWYKDDPNNNRDINIWGLFYGGFKGICPENTYYDPPMWFMHQTDNLVPTKDNLDNLAIIAESGTFFIDNVELYETCPDILRIENHNYFVDEGIVKAENYIYAGYDVGASSTDGNVIVSNSGAVNYQASEAVILKHGFRTEGGYFHAYNAPCDVSGSLNLYSQNPVNTYSDFSDNSVKIFPNPAKDKFSLEFNNPPGENVNVRIYDISGNEIYNNSFPYIVYKININISDFEPGMYLVKINTKSNEFVEKLMIN